MNRRKIKRKIHIDQDVIRKELWFAWYPVKTSNKGWCWLCHVMITQRLEKEWSYMIDMDFSYLEETWKTIDIRK